MAPPALAHGTIPLWREPAERRAPLPGDATVDVAIVGGGYTGLWTAYYLKLADPGLRVAVIERDFVGFGASGRNGGWASAIFPITLQHVAKGSSHEAALGLQHALNDTVDEIGRVVRHEGIEADFAKQGFLSLARSPAQLQRARLTVSGAVEFGLPDQWRVLDAVEAAETVRADRVLGGIHTEHCALVNPGRLVRGLAVAVERLGVQIYEGTTVTSIQDRRLETVHGTVRANVIVRATEGFTPQFKEFRRDLVPLYSLVLATEPLPDDLRKSLHLDHRVAFNDLRHLRIYAQMTADGRLVFGGRGAPYHFGSKVSDRFDQNPAIHAKIYKTMLDFFPALQDAAVTHRWGGPLGVPRDWHPSVGFDRVTGRAWAGPYVGDGVATSNLAGRILRNLILSRPDDLDRLPLVNHRSPRWEPEPLRWLGVNLGLRAAALGDVEERTTARPSKIAHLLESMTGAH